MCMEYEDEYGKCFDCLFFDSGGGNEGLITLLEEEYNVKIVNKTKFEAIVKQPFFKLLEKCHDEGVICPMNEKENNE